MSHVFGGVCWPNWPHTVAEQQTEEVDIIIHNKSAIN